MSKSTAWRRFGSCPASFPRCCELQARRLRLRHGHQSGRPRARRAFPREKFDLAHRFILDLFASQGIEFEAVFICPHFKQRGVRLPQAQARHGAGLSRQASRSTRRAAS